MFPYFVALIAFGAALATSNPANEKRAAESIGSIYAYGTGIAGFPIFYGDGTAYIGYKAPPGVGNAMNVTFNHPSSTNLSVVANPTDNAAGGFTPPSLFINNAANTIQPAGFITATNQTNSTTETSFTLFGHALYYKDSSGTFKAQFYATPTEMDNTWTLVWNTDNSVVADSVPVVLKNVAPPAISRRDHKL